MWQKSSRQQTCSINSAGSAIHVYSKISLGCCYEQDPRRRDLDIKYKTYMNPYEFCKEFLPHTPWVRRTPIGFHTADPVISLNQRLDYFRLDSMVSQCSWKNDQILCPGPRVTPQTGCYLVIQAYLYCFLVLLPCRYLASFSALLPLPALFSVLLLSDLLHSLLFLFPPLDVY